MPGGNMNIGSSLSALNAFTVRMNVTASNVANVVTDGFKSSSVVMESGPGQTVGANVVTDNSPGPMIPDQSGADGMQELSNVNMVKEMTQMIITRRGYDANLKAIESNLEMQGNLIDMIA